MPDPDNWFFRRFRGDVPPPPVADLLGERLTRIDLDAGVLDATFEAAPGFRNPAGTVQGGMLAAMLDALTAGLVDATLAPGEAVATLNLNTAYLRPARVGTLQGRAELQRRGKAVCHVRAELLQDGKPVASATAVCSIIAVPA